MNEIMLALETMIRRVVKEEIAATVLQPSTTNFGISFKGFVDANPAEFAAIISQGAVDQPWFDNAIKAEIAMTPVPEAVQASGFLLEIDTKDKFRRAVKDAVFEYYEDELNDHIYERVGSMDFSASIEVS